MAPRSQLADCAADVRTLHSQGKSQWEIAELLGVSQTTIYRWLPQLGLTPRTKADPRPKMKGKHWTWDRK
jgi:transposase